MMKTSLLAILEILKTGRILLWIVAFFRSGHALVPESANHGAMLYP